MKNNNAARPESDKYAGESVFLTLGERRRGIPGSRGHRVKIKRPAAGREARGRETRVARSRAALSHKLAQRATAEMQNIPRWPLETAIPRALVPRRRGD